jgi:hypothetical protein
MDLVVGGNQRSVGGLVVSIVAILELPFSGGRRPQSC